jgi:alkylation response protein AidB-like acyl-CoA dehydrogenase
MSDDPIRDIADSAARAAALAAAMPPPAAARRLGEDGLLGVLAPESVGGLGLPLAAAAAVVAATEAALVPLPVAEAMLAARLLAAPAPEVAAAIAAGEAIVAVATAGTFTLDGAKASGTVGRAQAGLAARWLIAPLAAPLAGAGGAVLLDLSAPGVVVAEERGLDLERPPARITATAAPALALPAGDALATFQADGLLLHAAGAIGAAEHCLGRAIDHISNRRQFGRALVGFQGLRFELARQKMALEGARAALAHALAVAGQDPRAESVARLVARAACADAAPAIIEAAIQLHGGMGFTWDLGLHRQLRRAREAALALDPMGARSALAARLEQAWAA